MLMGAVRLGDLESGGVVALAVAWGLLLYLLPGLLALKVAEAEAPLFPPWLRGALLALGPIGLLAVAVVLIAEELDDEGGEA